MRHKMVNLCPTTYEMAQKMRNFSGWIRKKLLEENTGYSWGLVWKCIPCDQRYTYKKTPRIQPECVYCGKELTEDLE